MPPTGHGTAPERRRAAVVAGHTGDPVTPRALLDDADDSVRCAALGGLARTGQLTVGELGAAARDTAASVRRRVAELLVTVPGDEATATLLVLLTDVDATVVEVAAWAAGERHGLTASVLDHLIIVAGGHDDALCREAAVAALGSLGDPRSLPAVLEALSDKAPVRRRAVIALAAFEGPEVEKALRAALTNRDRQVRQAAEDLLGR